MKRAGVPVRYSWHVSLVSPAGPETDLKSSRVVTQVEDVHKLSSVIGTVSCLV